MYDLHFKCRARRAPLPCKSRRARAVTFGSLHVFVERNSVERRNNQAPVGILTENGGKDHVVEQLEQKYRIEPTNHVSGNVSKQRASIIRLARGPGVSIAAVVRLAIDKHLHDAS